MLEVWKDFKDFENGIHDNKILNRISPLLEHIDDGAVLEAIKNDLYSKKIRKYRVGINRNDTYEKNHKRKNLFKGYDECVNDDDPTRRSASTLHKEDIRAWMEEFSLKIIQYLNTQRNI